MDYAIELVPFLMWVFFVCLAAFANFVFVGYNSMVNMFPEGRSLWDRPAQWATQIALILCGVFHPF